MRGVFGVERDLLCVSWLTGHLSLSSVLTIVIIALIL